MFDSLLGRGFAPKCKSLIIKLKNRLDVLKRKKKAVVGYLKNDIAELLKAGHDANAYGRVEGLMHEINRASCYEWIEKFCDCMYKQLSTMQKQGECPAESIEAVSSVVYAAARLNAELPELCSLRRLFTEKYGNCLESLVNQELVEKIASKPPSMDQKLQLMEQISQDFSIKWDLKAYKQKISNPSAAPYGEPINKGAFKNSKDGALEEKVTSPHGREEISPMLYYTRRKEINHNRKDLYDEQEVPFNKKWDLDSDGLPYAKEEQEQHTNKRFFNQSKDDAGAVEKISANEREELPTKVRYTLRKEADMDQKDVYEEREAPRNGRTDFVPGLRYARREQVSSNSKVHHHVTADDNNHPLSSYREAAGNAKPHYTRVTPPPYVKPNKHGNYPEAPHVVPGKTEPTSPSKGSSDNKTSGNSYRISPERNMHRDEKDHPGDGLVRESKPKPRSVRRKPARPPPVDEEIHVNPPEVDSPVEKKSPVARWAKPTTGFGVVKDEEEAMMDKLLIHYSKKGSSTYDDFRKSAGLRALVSDCDGETEGRGGRDAESFDSGSNHAPNRTASLPTEPAPEVAKLPARAASFQPGAGPHVHPKLPDYDVLAARFAALKGK